MPASLIDKLVAERSGVHGHVTVEELRAVIAKYSTIEKDGSGRVYLYSDARWVTNADDNYGTTYYQFAESAGTGSDPIMEWEHKGHYVRAGTILHELAIVGRILDAVTVADVEIIAVYTDPLGKWQDVGTGLDADGEDAHTILYRGFWKAGDIGGPAAFSGVVNDERERVLSLGDFVVPNNGDVRIYFKPVNVDPRPNTSTDYFQIFYSWSLSTLSKFT